MIRFIIIINIITNNTTTTTNTNTNTTTTNNNNDSNNNSFLFVLTLGCTFLFSPIETAPPPLLSFLISMFVKFVRE